MIYVKLEKQNDYYLVVLIHYQPMNDKNGLKKTREELLLNGIFVDSLPTEPAYKENEYAVLKADLQNKELYYTVHESQ